MKNIKWPFLFMALAAVVSIMAIGIAVGVRSTVGTIVSIIALVAIMGSGFVLKKKMRESGKI